MLNRETVTRDLQTGIYTVTFVKKDGTTRVMRCTLLAEYLPIGDNTYLVNGELVEKPKRKVPADSVSVWDLEKQDWRSFRVDSIVSMLKE